jgi:hypothetical protein
MKRYYAVYLDALWNGADSEERSLSGSLYMAGDATVTFGHKGDHVEAQASTLRMWDRVCLC